MTPNPTEFAKSVLWRLASIQADVYRNQLLLVALLANQTNQETEQVQNYYRAETEAKANQLYELSLKQAGLPRDEGPTSASKKKRRS